MHTMQSGHGSGRDVPVWDMIAADRGLAPARPTLDAEPNYEDHPVNPWPAWEPAHGYFRDWDVRKQTWRSVLAGGCGVTYGHHSIWQFCSPAIARINHAECYWTEALTRPGAEQMRHLRALLEPRIAGLVPDQTILADRPADRHSTTVAARDRDGAWAMLYAPNAGQTLRLSLGMLASPTAEAHWVDPRTGDRLRIGAVDTRAPLTLVTPARGPDWVALFESE
jgi:hypothetical protein